jgi:hypothetical protein
MQSKTNQVRYPEAKTQPNMQGQSMKRMMRKALPKNSTKYGFSITLQALKSHNIDLRRLINPKKLPNKKQTQQPSIQ